MDHTDEVNAVQRPSSILPANHHSSSQVHQSQSFNHTQSHSLSESDTLSNQTSSTRVSSDTLPSRTQKFKKLCFKKSGMCSSRSIISALLFLLIIGTVTGFALIKVLTKVDISGIIILFLGIICVEIALWVSVTFDIRFRLQPSQNEMALPPSQVRRNRTYRHTPRHLTTTAPVMVNVIERDGHQYITTPTIPSATYASPDQTIRHSSLPRDNTNIQSQPSNMVQIRRSHSHLIPQRHTRRPSFNLMAPWNRHEFYSSNYTQRIPRLDGRGGDEAVVVSSIHIPPPSYLSRFRDESRLIEPKTGLIRTLSQTRKRDKQVLARVRLLESRSQPLSTELERINSRTSVMSGVSLDDDSSNQSNNTQNSNFEKPSLPQSN